MKHTLFLYGLMTPVVFAADETGLFIDVDDVMVPSAIAIAPDNDSAPVTDTGERLRQVPGVTATRKGAKGFEPIIRGQQQNQLNVLMDNAYVYGACPGRMDPPTGYSSQVGYDRISVTRGYDSVIYGAGGSGGTIRLERDDPDFSKKLLNSQEYPSTVGKSFAGYTGNSSTRTLALDIAAGSDSTYLRAYGEHQNAGNYKTGKGKSISSAFRSDSGGLLLSGDVTEHTRMELNVEAVRDNDVYYSGNGMDAPWAKADIWRFKTLYNQALVIFDSLEFSVYRSDVQHLMDNYSVRRRKPESSTGLRAPSSSLTWGGRLLGITRFDQGELSSGLDYQANDRDARRYKSDLGGTDASVFQSHMWPGVEYRQLGAFTELDYDLNDTHHFRAGIRYDRFRADATRANNLALGDNSPDALYQKYYGTLAKTKREGNLSGLVSWAHDVSEIQSIEVKTSRSVRTADASERFIASRGSCCHGSDDWVGNPDIKPEKHHQLDASYQHQLHNLSFTATAYIDEVSDYILRSSSESGAVLYQNVDARLYGLELETRYHSGFWKPVLSVAWTRGINKDSTDRKYLPQIPPLMATLKLDYQTRLWLLGARCELASSQAEVDTASGLDAGSSKGYAIFHLYGWYQLTPSLKLQGGVENLLNKNYAMHVNHASRDPFNPEALRVNEPGRQVWLGISMKF